MLVASGVAKLTCISILFSLGLQCDTAGYHLEKGLSFDHIFCSLDFMYKSSVLFEFEFVLFLFFFTYSTLLLEFLKFSPGHESLLILTSCPDLCGIIAFLFYIERDILFGHSVALCSCVVPLPSF